MVNPSPFERNRTPQNLQRQGTLAGSTLRSLFHNTPENQAPLCVQRPLGTGGDPAVTPHLLGSLFLLSADGPTGVHALQRLRVFVSWRAHEVPSTSLIFTESPQPKRKHDRLTNEEIRLRGVPETCLRGCGYEPIRTRLEQRVSGSGNHTLDHRALLTWSPCLPTVKTASMMLYTPSGRWGLSSARLIRN